MSSVTLYNNTGKEAGKVELSNAVFAVAPKSSLIHQVYEALRANLRQPWAHAKDRSEVRGGGKKPWKQKGTGRARHGSSRSPIWKGGGVTFGPRAERSYEQKINRKMNQSAVAMCLSAKVKSSTLYVVESFMETGKTKDAVVLQTALRGVGRSVLFITNEKNDAVLRATRNIPRCTVRRAQDVNVLDLLHHQMVIADVPATQALERRLA